MDGVANDSCVVVVVCSLAAYLTCVARARPAPSANRGGAGWQLFVESDFPAALRVMRRRRAAERSRGTASACAEVPGGVDSAGQRLLGQRTQTHDAG